MSSEPFNLEKFLATYIVSSTSKDMFALLCGAFIGHGVSRHVFEHRLDPTCVVKIQTIGDLRQNEWEWKTWNSSETKPGLRRVLAPCVMISPNSRILIQKQTTVAIPDRTGWKCPLAYMPDAKIENFGMYEGRIVCHDYGMWCNPRI